VFVDVMFCRCFPDLKCVHQKTAISYCCYAQQNSQKGGIILQHIDTKSM